MDEPTYTGAAPAERSARVDSIDARIHVLEWGDPAAVPVVFCHGMYDHARSFAVVATALAERFRVISMDARGHGDSDWTDSYLWSLDVLDIVSVLRWVGRPVRLVGHSKGGGQATEAAAIEPDLVERLVNIDGFGPPPFREEDEASPEGCRKYLDSRRAAADWRWRPYASFDELVRRRAEQNRRLSEDWLRYFVFHAARESEEGWRWKADPFMREGFGPWRPEWIGPGYRQLRSPMLAITGTEEDTWGPLPEEILAPRLAHVADLHRVAISGAGHFVHMEKPAQTVSALLDFFS